MKLFGKFEDLRREHTYEVNVVNNESYGTDSLEVGTGSLWWDSSPVTIESKCDNYEDVIIESRCTLNFVTERLLSGLFSTDVMDTTVEVRSEVGVLFRGYVEPRTYSQAYDDETNSLSINCIDCLTALKSLPFRDVRSRGDYESAMKLSGMSSMRSLLLESLSKSCVKGGVYYDNSKQPASGDGLLLDVLMVNESLYLGSSYEDVKSYYDVVSDLLRYLGLHAAMWNGSVYLFSRESLLHDTLHWSLLGGDESSSEVSQWCGGELSTEHLGGTDGNVEYGEVFNQVALTISPRSSETIVRSPLESGGTVPSMGGRVTYLTEYAVDGVGISAARSFYSLVKSHTDDKYDGEKVWKDTMIRPMRNIYWKIGRGSGPGSSPVEWTTLGDKDSESMTDRLGSGLGAMLLQVGEIDHKPGKGDNSKQTSVSMSTQLVISVNGNKDDSSPRPTDEDIMNSMPLMSYENGDVAAVYSPTDKTMRDYLVISGSLVLCPIMTTPFTVESVRSYADGDSFYREFAHDNGNTDVANFAKVFAKTVPSRGNGDGRYLSFEWWRGGQPSGTRTGFIGDTGDGPEQYEYKSQDGKDTMSKFDVLWCMLRIGDQVLVEDKSKSGELSAFSWQQYKSLSDCGNVVDEYLRQTFTIGIDPKIGDKMIGQEFSIGTNFDYTTNISASEGMAIPLPYDNHLHGVLRLEILGIDNGPWSDYHKTRHATMFRHSRWSTDEVPLMAHVSSVIVRNFSIKFYSDGTDSDDDTDIVYLSRCTDRYINKKEITGSIIHSGFTGSEVNAYNLNNKILKSTVCDSSGDAVLLIKDIYSGETGKPECLYVNALWRRLHAPYRILTQSVRPAVVSPFGRYHVESLGQSMNVLSYKCNLGDGVCKVKLI